MNAATTTVLGGLLLAACCTPRPGHELPPGPVGNQGSAKVLDMVHVPKVAAILGCDQGQADCPKTAIPRRTVEHDGFWIDRLEVSERAYALCVEAGACHGGPEREFARPDSPAIAQHPDDARTYCAWRGARLPTSIEWEIAARGTDGRAFPWGDAPPDCTRAFYSDCIDLRLHATTPARPMSYVIGSHPRGASPYGLQDVAGGVGEWSECDTGARDCIGVIHGSEHNGVAGLRTYASTPIAPGGVLDFLHVGFRCARG